MAQNFQPGDFLVFQLESGYALMRLLGVDVQDNDTIWHLTVYGDFFPDLDLAEAASAFPDKLSKNSDHIALTNRAFESTQVAKISNLSLTEKELEPLRGWRNSENQEISDRSVRLMMGLR